MEKRKLDNGRGIQMSGQPRRGGLREGGRDRDVLKVVVRAPPKTRKDASGVTDRGITCQHPLP